MGQPTIKYRKSSSLVRVKHAVKQSQKRLLYFSSWEAAKDCSSVSKVDGVANMKEGHFSVLTLGNGDPKKFLVALSYLAYPPFVELPKAAEREFGFDQQGVLAIPCEASELQRILSGEQIVGNQETMGIHTGVWHSFVWQRCAARG